MSDVSLDIIRDYAASFMSSSPIQYVKDAKLHGKIFDNAADGSVSSADTGFSVDHQEPLAALKSVKKAGVKWPFG